MNNLHVFPSSTDLSAAAADFILDIANKCVQETGKFSLSLSGGHTPEQLFSLLATPPYRRQMPWNQTKVFWGDERCVPADDPRNNAFQAISLLLDKVEIPESNIYRIPSQLLPEKAAKQYEAELHAVFDPAPPRFDLILLGLGTDGHTASLFPGTAVLAEKTRWIREVFVPDQDMYRVTMTLPLINQASNILFLVAGTAKAAILKKVLKPVGSMAFPAQLVQPYHGKLYWYADAEAAAHVSV